MDHHEQHHQHHRKEREHEKKKHAEHDRAAEDSPRRIHPRWFLVTGVVLIAFVVLLWILIIP